MFRKKVKLFGRSIPVTVILLVLVTAVALAVFMNIYLGSINISAAGAPDGVLVMDDCQIINGGEVPFCVLSDNTIHVTGNGLQPESEITTSFTYTPTSDQYFTFTPPDPMPAGLSEIISSLANGSLLSADVPQVFDVVMKFETLQPGEIMPEYNWALQFSE